MPSVKSFGFAVRAKVVTAVADAGILATKENSTSDEFVVPPLETTPLDTTAAMV